MTRRVSDVHADLDRLIDFYSRQQDFVGGGCRVIPVRLSPKALDRFAKRLEDGDWSYRGCRLRRAAGSPA